MKCPSFAPGFGEAGYVYSDTLNKDPSQKLLHHECLIVHPFSLQLALY